MTDGLNKNADGTLTITIQKDRSTIQPIGYPRRGTVQSYHVLDGSLLNAPRTGSAKRAFIPGGTVR